jgi:membrane protein required for colicin V production
VTLLATRPSLGSLTLLDVALLIVLLYSLARGFFTGFITELGLLLALVAGTIVAGRVAAQVGAPLAGVGLGVSARAVAGYVVVLAVIWIAVRIATRVLRRGARILMLGLVDRLAGAVFGLLRGVLIVVVVGFLVVHFDVTALRADAHASPLVRAASPVFPTLNRLLPPHLRAGPTRP